MQNKAILAALLLALCAAPGSRGPRDLRAEGPYRERIATIEPGGYDESVRRGFSWLAAMQHPSGGWSQGEAGRQGVQAQDQPSLADTCIAVQALLRSGSTRSQGPYAENIRRGLDFMLREVEASDADSMYVTSVRNTRVQSKLGPYIDTFMTSQVLTEVKDQVGDTATSRRILAALSKIMHKIEKNQQEDGTWDKRGWAPVLSQSMATKAINQAAGAGLRVNEKVRERAEEYSRKQFDAKSGRFSEAGSAGVDLYSSTGNLAAMEASDAANRPLERMARQKASSSDAEERKKAEQELARIEGNRKDLEKARDAVARKLADERFIQGFGSNGGEEFLSYLNLGESLAAQGGDKWNQWKGIIRDRMMLAQNKDGSWTGHHCITGRTFCTAAALLVMTLERPSKPVQTGAL